MQPRNWGYKSSMSAYHQDFLHCALCSWTYVFWMMHSTHLRNTVHSVPFIGQLPMSLAVLLLKRRGTAKVLLKMQEKCCKISRWLECLQLLAWWTCCQKIQQQELVLTWSVLACNNLGDVKIAVEAWLNWTARFPVFSISMKNEVKLLNLYMLQCSINVLDAYFEIWRSFEPFEKLGLTWLTIMFCTATELGAVVAKVLVEIYGDHLWERCQNCSN